MTRSMLIVLAVTLHLIGMAGLALFVVDRLREVLIEVRAVRAILSKTPEPEPESPRPIRPPDRTIKRLQRAS